MLFVYTYIYIYPLYIYLIFISCTENFPCKRHRRQERKTIKYKSDITHSQFEGENIKKKKPNGNDDDENENKYNNMLLYEESNQQM